VFGASDSRAAQMRVDLETRPEHYRRGRVSRRNLVMADYVDAWKREHPELAHRVQWKDLAPDFNKTHPEFEPYTPQTMRHKYWELRGPHTR
ncbi:MAG: hypothetical protein U1E29_12375, partial [Coriobacteriia bacterium]|nr:hypothetical protein [Coriobacteriia bacterium]